MTYTQPFTLLFLSIMAVGLYHLRRQWRTVSWRIAVCGYLAMAALTWQPAAAVLATPLTARYENVTGTAPSGDAEVIVVLGGGVEYKGKRRPYDLAGRDTYRRILHAAWLFHDWKSLPVLASGGSEFPGRLAVSAVMRRLLEQEGVPSSKIWTEEQSRSTYENALYSAKLLHERGIHRIALVVDADSMLRAEMCFRKQGLAVTPAPCMFWNSRLEWQDLLPGWEGIYRNEILAHEGIGLLWYWLKGRI